MVDITAAEVCKRWWRLLWLNLGLTRRNCPHIMTQLRHSFNSCGSWYPDWARIPWAINRI